MTIKKVFGNIHLWLGFTSGLLVLFLSLTGCILAFEQEFRSLLEPYRRVTITDKTYLPVTRLKEIAETRLEGKKVNGVEIPGRGMAAIASFYDENDYKTVFLDPGTGEILKVKNMNRDFFRLVVNGHYNLWLPIPIGQPIVAIGTLVFVVLMITGLILWWPKSKAARKQRFSVKFSARWRRVNYDLHNVLGFYMTWIGIFIALTGLVFGFEWFANSVYFVTSGGKTPVAHVHPVSDTTARLAALPVADRVFAHHLSMAKPDESISVYFPITNTDPVEVSHNHRPGTYYNSDYYHYDQYKGIELPATGSYAGRFSDAAIADKIVRMNYDLHVGAVLGIPGKILVFLASLISGSLPVTGFLIWWGRRKKRKAEAKAVTGSVRSLNKQVQPL